MAVGSHPHLTSFTYGGDVISQVNVAPSSAFSLSVYSTGVIHRTLLSCSIQSSLGVLCWRVVEKIILIKNVRILCKQMILTKVDNLDPVIQLLRNGSDTCDVFPASYLIL